MPYTFKRTGTSLKTQSRTRDLPAKDAVSDMSFERPMCPGAEAATAATVIDVQRGELPAVLTIIATLRGRLSAAG